MGDEFSSFTVYTYGDALVHTTSAQLRKLSWLEEQPLTSRFLHSHYLPLHLSPSPPPSLLQFASLKFLPNVSCLLLAVLKSWYPLQLERERFSTFSLALWKLERRLLSRRRWLLIVKSVCLLFTYIFFSQYFLPFFFFQNLLMIDDGFRLIDLKIIVSILAISNLVIFLKFGLV